MKFYIVDAFTDTLFGGNPAGVVLLDETDGFPEDETMRLTAAELRYSETAFVKQVEHGVYHTRYFTPVDEVDLCGHATIGAFFVLMSEGRIQAGATLTNRTLAGDLRIQTEPGKVMMDMAAPQLLGEIVAPDALEEIYGVMGLPVMSVRAKDINGNEVVLMPSMISTGLPDIILPVADASRLADIHPDQEALAALSKRYGVVGVHAFALAQDATAYCRNFAPLYGIPEEAATGTSNGALTYYLYNNGLLKSGSHAKFIQGREMGRPSIIESRLEIKDAALSIQVGGTGVILAQGEIFI